MQAYYFHGLKSKLRSRKATVLKEYFNKYLVELHEIDLNIPSPNEYKLEEIVDKSKRYIEYTSTFNERIILIGSSFGCYVIMNLYRFLEDSKIFKVVFMSPVFDLKKASLYRQKHIDGTIVNYYLKSFDEEIIRIKDDMGFFEVNFKTNKPLLIIHGSKDKIISYKYSEEYAFRAENKNVEFFLIESDHRLYENFNEALAKIDSFIFGFDGHRVITFDHSNPLFHLWRSSIISVLRNSYAEDYFGDDYHIRKIVKRNCRLFLVFDDKDHSKRRELIGCSYIDPQGKHLAMGILPEYQKQGIGRTIFEFSLLFSSFQYAETENLHVIKILLRTGFEEVNVIRKVKETLGPFKSSLIKRFFFQDGHLYYVRKSAILDSEFRFRLLIKKKNAPI